MIVKFKKYTCNIELGQYANGRLAIKLTNAVQDLANDLFLGEPIATATVNVPEIELSENELIVKSYSENEGMVNALQEAGLITNPREQSIRHVNVYVADKTELLLEMEANKFKAKKLKM